MSQILRSILTLAVVPNLKSRKARSTVLFNQIKTLTGKPCSVTRKTLGFRARQNGSGTKESLNLDLVTMDIAGHNRGKVP